MAEHDERDSVASRDAFEKMCRRYFFHRRANIIADLSRREKRTRKVRRASSRLAARDKRELVRVLHGGV